MRFITMSALRVAMAAAIVLAVSYTAPAAFGASTASTEAATAVSVTSGGDRSHTAPGSPFYALTATEAMTYGGDSGLHAFELLRDNGAGIGAVNDRSDSTMYVRIGTVVELGYGTATVTIDGLAFCIDGETGACSGGEYMTDGWLGVHVSDPVGNAWTV
jgi:hypothetical protein